MDWVAPAPSISSWATSVRSWDGTLSGWKSTTGTRSGKIQKFVLSNSGSTASGLRWRDPAVGTATGHRGHPIRRYRLPYISVRYRSISAGLTWSLTARNSARFPSAK